MFLDNYYRLNKLKDFKYGVEYCSFCFLEAGSCKCNEEVINHREALRLVEWLEGVAKQEALINLEALLIEDELVPLYHAKGSYNPNLSYCVVPRYTLPLIGLMIDVDGEYFFDETGEALELNLELDIFERGFYWGYESKGKFVPISRYGVNGHDIKFIKSRYPEYEVEETPLPPINDDLAEHLSGYFLVPLVTDNLTKLLCTMILE